MAVPTELATWEPTWTREADQARSCLLWAAEGRIQTVEHVGATAIAGSPARPMIDLVGVLATDTNHLEVLPYILGLNYQPATFPYASRDRTAVYFEKERGGDVMHTLQLVKPDSSVLTNAVLAREWFRAHLDEAQRFVTLKMTLFARYGCNQGAYADGKHVFLTHVLEQAASAARDASSL